MATIQVTNFCRKAKEAGLKRSDFSCQAPKDKYGEYQSLNIVIWSSANMTEEKCRVLAEDYRVTIYIIDGKTRWCRPHISEDYANAGLFVKHLS